MGPGAGPVVAVTGATGGTVGWAKRTSTAAVLEGAALDSPSATGGPAIGAPGTAGGVEYGASG